MAETIRITRDNITIHRGDKHIAYSRNGEAVPDPNSEELVWLPNTAPAAELKLGVMKGYTGPGATPREPIDVFASSTATTGLEVDAPRTGVVVGLSTPGQKIYTQA